MADPRNEYGTVLGPDATFKGELNFDSAAMVQGRIDGSIKSKGMVLIADGSTCKASITANEIAVEGHVKGNIEAHERVEIRATGKMTGDIIAARMTMADGAAFEGHVQIGVSPKETKANSTAEPKVTVGRAATAKAAR